MISTLTVVNANKEIVMTDKETTDSTIDSSLTAEKNSTAAPKKPAVSEKRMQNTITVAIIASVLLFFAGLGLGFLVGKQTGTTTSGRDSINPRGFSDGTTPSGGFDGPRFRERGMMDDDTTNDDTSSSSNTQEN